MLGTSQYDHADSLEKDKREQLKGEELVMRADLLRHTPL